MNETILKVITSLQSNTSELRSILNFNENERHYIIQAMRDIQQAVDFHFAAGLEHGGAHPVELHEWDEKGANQKVLGSV